MTNKKLFLPILIILLFYIQNSYASNLWILTGHFVPGGHVFGLTDPATKVMIDDKPVFTNKEGWFVIGFSAKPILRYKLKLIGADGTQKIEIINLKNRLFRSTKIKGLQKSKITPSSKNTARIEKESELLTNIRNTNPTISNDFLKKWRQPVIGRETGKYGDMRVLNNIVSSQHFGQDLAAPIGKTVVAANDGIVILAQQLYLSGNTIVIDHGFGILSSYLHLNKVNVQVGQHISSGKKIGTVGATGRVTGPHLDWRISWFNVRLDPVLFVKQKSMYPGFLDNNNFLYK